MLSVFSLVGSLVIGLVLLLNFDSWLAFFAFPLASACLIVYSQMLKRKHQPKIKKIDRNEVIVETMPYGDICFATRTTSTVEVVG